MLQRIHLRVIVLATTAVFLTLAGTAAAQGVMFGRVTNENGVGLEGVKVSAESESDPRPRTATTNDKGEFTVVGLRTGAWYLTFEADGYLPATAGQQVSGLSKPTAINVQLEPGMTFGEGDVVDSAEVKAELDEAEALASMGDHAGALAAYEALSEKLPELTAIRVQIASLYNDMREHDKALAELDGVLVVEPGNARAKMARATTLLLKGDVEAAEAALTEIAAAGGGSAETYFNLGEVLFSQGNAEGASGYYEKAAAANPTWGRPLFKLALVALNKGDMETAASHLEKVIEVEPNSEDAGSARLMLEQIKPQ